MLRGGKTSNLPVFWQTNKKAEVKAAIFEDLISKNLNFKALLVLDNAPSHCSLNLNLDYSNTSVTFLLSQTTSILKPLDMGVIKTFESYCTKNVYHKAIRTTHSPDKLDEPCTLGTT